MSNHLHALMQIADRPLGKVMQRIAVRYSRYRRKALHTRRHLFERKYRAKLYRCRCVERADGLAPPKTELTADVEARLAAGNVRRKPRAFALAAVRETFEETDLIVGTPGGRLPLAPKSWAKYCKHNTAAKLDKLDFVCRAITPPHQACRFDARFFFAYAEDVLLDDRPHRGSGEIQHIEWFTFTEAEAPRPTHGDAHRDR